MLIYFFKKIHYCICILSLKVTARTSCSNEQMWERAFSSLFSKLDEMWGIQSGHDICKSVPHLYFVLHLLLVSTGSGRFCASDQVNESAQNTPLHSHLHRRSLQRISHPKGPPWVFYHISQLFSLLHR